MNTAMNSDNSWRGVPLSEIYGSQSPWGAPEFPLVAPGFNHTVLYHVPSSGCVPGDRPPKAQIGHDKWDHDFVRMPCSSQSLYPVEDSTGDTHLQKRWEIIVDTLSKPISNSQELAKAILSYNTQFKNTWKFKALHKLFNEHLEEEEAQYFFDVTLPEIAKLALSLPKLIQHPIPLLKQHKNHSVSLSQQQISSLLANAFFCTFPRRNSNKKTSEYASFPHINFNSLYESSGSDCNLEKLKSLCHYFRRVCSKAPVGVVTFSRRSVPPRKCPEWVDSDRPVTSVPLHVDSTGTIEDASGLIQLDFANKFLGGGVLGHGCVQEEIRFVICPELMVSMLFTEVMRPNEALIMIGTEQYSKYTGYGHSFQWAGDHIDQSPSDSSCRRRTAVLAVDARPYSAVALQYRRECIDRELNKAWVGFSFYTDNSGTQYPGIATGNWGCGAFGGSPQLKSLIQIMACAEARRPMAYYTFHDEELRDEIVNAYNMLARFNVTVGQLYKLILRYSTTDVRKTPLYAFIHQALRDDAKQKSSPKPNQVQASTSSKCENELTESLNEELLKESPDLFSQDELENFKNEVQALENKSKIEADTENGRDQNINVSMPEQNKELANQNRMAEIDKMAPGLTSHLFEEMNKFDQVNGRLNFSNTHVNSEKSMKIAINESMDIDNEMSTDVEEKSSSTSSKVTNAKKEIKGKITDYFSKKSI